jgi:hypothetical protein
MHVKNVRVLYMDSTDHMKIAVFKELQDAIKIRRINDELLEYLIGSIQWIIRYAYKNHLTIPDKDKMITMLDKVIKLKSQYPI